MRTLNAQILDQRNGHYERLLSSTAGKRAFSDVPRALLARSRLTLLLHYLVWPRELRGGIMAVGGWLGNLLLMLRSALTAVCDTNELKPTVLWTLQVSLTPLCVTGKVPQQTHRPPSQSWCQRCFPSQWPLSVWVMQLQKAKKHKLFLMVMSTRVHWEIRDCEGSWWELSKQRLEKYH